jgi:hypothetical protein
MKWWTTKGAAAPAATTISGVPEPTTEKVLNLVG